MPQISPNVLKHLQRFGWLVLRPLLKFFIRYQTCPNCDITKLKRPFIIASNHLSLLDPPIIGTALPIDCDVYPSYFITKDTYMAAPLLGSFLRLWGAFPAKKGEGLESSLTEPKAIIKSGCSVVFFPEGGLKQEFKIENGKPGTATLALETETPILPMAICGIKKFSWKDFFLRRYTVRVAVGNPFLLKEKLEQCYCQGNIEVGTQIIMREIKSLLARQ